MKRSILVASLSGIFFAIGPIRTQGQVAPNVLPDVVYGHKYGMALTFDVFTPSADPNGAGVLFMVSGGWVSRWSPPERTVRRFKLLLDKGFTVFAVRHGSSPKFNIPEVVPDVRQAVRFIRLHAKDYGVKPDRLGVYGASAGGHLSLLLGTTSDNGDAGASDEVERTSDRVAAVVAYYPPVDLRGWARDPGDPTSRTNTAFPALIFDPQKAQAMSPIMHVTPDDPPTLLVHGDRDRLVPLSHSERIHAALKESGVPTELIIIKGAGHGFRGADNRRASAAMVAWFEKYLTGK